MEGNHVAAIHDSHLTTLPCDVSLMHFYHESHISCQTYTPQIFRWDRQCKTKSLPIITRSEDEERKKKKRPKLATVLNKVNVVQCWVCQDWIETNITKHSNTTDKCLKLQGRRKEFLKFRTYLDVKFISIASQGTFTCHLQTWTNFF